MSQNFASFIRQTSLVANSTPEPAIIEKNIDSRASLQKNIQVMYGETYDRLGPALDSLKYYFFVAACGRLLRDKGISATATILVADVATCRNELEDRHAELMELGKARAEFVKSVNQIYHLNLNIVLMSDYLFSSEFQRRVESVRKLADVNKDVFRWIRQTVPNSKVEIEEEKGFAYAFDEVATIIDYDLKIGPPREIFYDEPARQIGQVMGLDPLQGIYLHPTFPLAQGRGFFLKNEEVARYGVTPYKAGSKGLQQYRVILGETSPERLSQLVNETPISPKLTMPNPILDLAIIGEMAHQWLKDELRPIDIRDKYFDKLITVDELKRMAVDNIYNYVFKPLELSH